MEFSDFRLDKCADRLLPVIIQDSATLRVLMLGYMNQEAFDKTIAEGRVTFFSRSRKKLWTKGETSGNFLDVVEIYPDCDMDTLLIKAVPHGPTCHRGTVSCFDTPASDGFMRTLAGVISDRHEAMPDKSYTTSLFIKGPKRIAKKVGEETTEAIIEAVTGRRDRFIYETADLIYHFLVLLEEMHVSISELENELLHRHS